MSDALCSFLSHLLAFLAVIAAALWFALVVPYLWRTVR
jgi:hypothetical protein